MNGSILVVDDEMDFLESVRRGLISSGFRNVELERDPVRASTRFEQGEAFDVVLIDISMPQMDGVTLLERIKNSNSHTECIMVTALNDAKMAVECLKKGAYHYLVKPISREDLVSVLRNTFERMRLLDIIDISRKKEPPKLIHEEAFSSIITASSKMLKILREAELHAVSDVPVLISGESGTGKELLARAIHKVSTRAAFPFTPINMASLPGNLFESEFFGHTQGAFTGAERDRKGFLEYTHRGTLFLDEIGDLSLELQGKLLRVLQDGEYIKIGTNCPQKTDVRFIAATNKCLERMMTRGVFRNDFYYRLKGAWLHLPPLRERKEDIPLLIKEFLEEFYRDAKNPGADAGAMSLLREYHYPGNIRELRSILQSAVNLSKGKPISVNDLPGQLKIRKGALKNDLSTGEESATMPLKEVEKAHIFRTYNKTGKNKENTARLLGIGINTLRRKLTLYGID
jgi:DNA-binding NtrC family response regulator